MGYFSLPSSLANGKHTFVDRGAKLAVLEAEGAALWSAPSGERTSVCIYSGIKCLFFPGTGLGAAHSSSALKAAQYSFIPKAWSDSSGHNIINHTEETAGVLGDGSSEQFRSVVLNLWATSPQGLYVRYPAD